MDLKFSPLSENDFDTLIRWAESPKDLLMWAGPNLVYPLTHQKLNDYLAPSKVNQPRMYAFTGKIGSDTVGMAELNAVDRINSGGTLCRVYVDKNHRGKGIAEQMVKHVLRFGFEELGLNRIDLRVYSQNLPAVKCYERLGFFKEACLRKSAKFENEFWDVLIYSMLAEEWKNKT
jgi:RimJ/RimL family protein N-acetyltransferase